MLSKRIVTKRTVHKSCILLRMHASVTHYSAQSTFCIEHCRITTGSCTGSSLRILYLVSMLTHEALLTQYCFADMMQGGFSRRSAKLQRVVALPSHTAMHRQRQLLSSQTCVGKHRSPPILAAMLPAQLLSPATDRCTSSITWASCSMASKLATCCRKIVTSRCSSLQRSSAKPKLDFRRASPRRRKEVSPPSRAISCRKPCIRCSAFAGSN